jgi:threonine aldolase
MKHLIDLRSDTVTRPSPGMLRAMMRSPVGDDVFGDDPTVNQLQDKVAAMLGKQAGLFLPSGTMANQVAVNCLTQAGDEVILDRESHIFRYEVAAASVISAVQLCPLDGRGGVMTAGQVEAAIRDRDVHQPRTALVCLENTHNRAGGTVYPLAEIERIAKLCRRHGVRLYLDGARLWNASAASGVALREYSRPFDGVMVCLSKGLGCPAGSVLVGSRGLIERARRTRKMLGGGMRQSGILAGAGLYALRHNLKQLRDDHRRARRLAEIIADITTVRIDLDSVQTNIVVFDIARTGMGPMEAVKRLAGRGVSVVGFGKTQLRAVTHLDVDDSDIELAGRALVQVLGKARLTIH